MNDKNWHGTPHLYTHSYDIDDIITALCTAPAGGVSLNTQSGSIVAFTAETEHIFTLEKLPTSFATELAHHALLPPEGDPLRTDILHHLAHTPLDNWPALFDDGRTGGWLRERVKDAALEWLDAANLIPPSMRHIPRHSRLAPIKSGKISIQ